jgi:hypothetical protein
MQTLGGANWRLPAILDRWLPRVNLEDTGEPAGEASHEVLEGTSEPRPAAKA